METFKDIEVSHHELQKTKRFRFITVVNRHPKILQLVVSVDKSNEILVETVAKPFNAIANSEKLKKAEKKR